MRSRVVVLCLLLACSERVIDQEGAELEISSSDVRARTVQVLEEKVDRQVDSCRCTYPGICYQCDQKGCGVGLHLCSGVQPCELKVRTQTRREIITIKGNKTVFSYPYERREVLGTTITGQCH